jgi:hypothetical protein
MALLQDPVRKCTAVTPSDSTSQGDVRGLYVGTGGNVAIRMKGDSAAVVHKNVPSGSYLPCRATYVYSTGTTATDIVAWF